MTPHRGRHEAAFFMGDRVITGWRFNVRWLLISVKRNGLVRHEFEVIQRSRGAYRS